MKNHLFGQYVFFLPSWVPPSEPVCQGTGVGVVRHTGGGTFPFAGPTWKKTRGVTPPISPKFLKTFFGEKKAAGWWLNQPIWKIFVKNGNLLQIGVNMKNIWNHHLGSYILPPWTSTSFIFRLLDTPTFNCPPLKRYRNLKRKRVFQP